MIKTHVRLDRQALSLFDQALESNPDDPQAFIRAARHHSLDVRERANSLLAMHMNSVVPLKTGGARTLLHHDPPERIGAYRILECLGRGGMGAVYLAERASGDFDHVVAIKLINAGALSEELADRFRHERQIFARLNHPHIARLYDGGETEGGEPFIVMEYVDGVPLDRWIAEENPSQDRRLNLFAQICGAVQFAHQNLVIHRDITSANVLVKNGDEAKLIDFGISRDIGDKHANEPGNALTVPNMAEQSMTPGFAAPERLLGAAATTLTDIYSLGKLLEILVGKRKIDRDIAAIVSRATAENPEHRYRTAQSLIDDMQQYRDGRPVAAREGGRGYHLSKFLKRERYGVGIAGIMLFLLIGGLVATTIGFERARTAQGEAESRLADTRAIAGAMMFDVFDKVSETPGTSEARLLIARTAQRYLTEIAEDPNASVEARLAAGRGFYRLATATGALDIGNRGDLRQGIALLERAVVMLEQLMEEAPSDEARLALANVYTSLARDKGQSYIDTAGSLAHLERARVLLDQIERPTAEVVAAQGRNQRYLGDLLGCCNGRPAEGRAEIRRGIERIEASAPAIRAEPSVARAYNDLVNLGAGYRIFIDDDIDGGIRTFYRAFEAQRSLTRRTGSPADHRLLATIAINLSRTLLLRDRAAEADRVLATVHQRTENLYRADPSDNDLQRRLSSTSLLRARIAAETGRIDDAERYLSHGLRLARLAERPNPRPDIPVLHYAHRLQEASDAQWALGQYEAACASMIRSVTIYQNYADRMDLPVTALRYRIRPMVDRMQSCPGRPYAQLVALAR